VAFDDMKLHSWQHSAEIRHVKIQKQLGAVVYSEAAAALNFLRRPGAGATMPAASIIGCM
jgi:hypothetical protein